MRTTLFHRLLATVCGVAALSIGLAIAIQDRGLSHDLERAALSRLDTAAEAAAGLLDAHLRAMADRYRAASRTPQLRATLEIQDAPTLAHFAESLARQQGAARILFVDAEGELVAAGGPQRLPTAAAMRDDVSLLAHGERVYAATSLPLEAAGGVAGRLVAVEPIGRATLREWSRLLGTQVTVGPADAPPPDDGAEATVRAVGGLELRVASSLESEREALARSRRNLFAGGLLGLAAAFAASLFLSRGLARPILEIRSAAERIGEGDLTVALTSRRRDEIGDVARTFEAMARSLRAMVGRVAQAADGVESATSEIQVVSERQIGTMTEQLRGSEHAAGAMQRMNVRMGEIASSSARSGHTLEAAVDGSSLSFRELAATGDTLRENAATLATRVDEITTSMGQMVESARHVATNTGSLVEASEQTTRSMEEMVASSREVNANAEEGARISRTVVETAEQGRSRVTETVKAMQGIDGATDEARGAILSLDQRVARIGTILEVIDHVTDETSLLALNASIIAAQAGERGRAFSVVAEQMKALAHRVLAGTQEIGGLIRAVQEESAKAIATIESGAERVKSGVDLAADAGRSLDEITRAARESGGRMAEIVSATAAQTRTAAHVLQQMERVRGGAEAIRTAVAEQERGNEVVFRNAVELHEVAERVRETIEVQGEGAARIGASIETVRGSVVSITGALEDQSRACREAADLLAHSRAHTETSEESVRRMEAAMADLLRQAELLREDVRRFRV